MPIKRPLIAELHAEDLVLEGLRSGRLKLLLSEMHAC